MNHLRTLFSFALVCGLVVFGHAQERYLDEVFSSVTITSDTTYATNISIFPIIAGAATMPVPVPLEMDVYEPMGDTASMRPLILFAHTGTFFPPAVNGGPSGARTDSICVEFATRMAKRGYVVAVFTYRKGWNATSSNAEVKRKTILEAAYRGIHDARACVRYFRRNVAEDGNGWRIDPDRIAMGGDGTGGYVTYGATYLKRFEQVFITKFIDFTDPMNPVPYVDTLQLGQPYGLDSVALNIVNHPGYSSDFSMGFALGGALGDSSWVEPNDPPFVSFHCYRDPFAPYAVGDVIEPVNDDVVIAQASGGFSTMTQSNAKGNQDIFKAVSWNDPFTMAQESNPQNNGLDGMFSFVTPDPMMGDTTCITSLPVPADTFQNWGSPWSWFNPAVYEATWNFVYADAISNGQQITGAEAVCRASLGSPNDGAAAKIYIDSIVGYLSPRLAIALDLQTSVGIEDELSQEIGFQAFPNPANQQLTLQVADPAHPIQEVRLTDITGRTVYTQTGLSRTHTTIDRNNLPAGIYVLQVQVKGGTVVEKIQFD
ncbi:MAG: T9SS type A sorting domain-containing protein [Bacteroidota bacterium]